MRKPELVQLTYGWAISGLDLTQDNRLKKTDVQNDPTLAITDETKEKMYKLGWGFSGPYLIPLKKDRRVCQGD